jgi:thioredoxin-disulfide reductase
MNTIYDVVIIGAGPGGLTAAIYGMRAGLKTLLIEKAYVSGGQIINTAEVDNYPGIPRVSGMELANKFKEHAENMGVTFVRTEVTDIEVQSDIKKIITSAEIYSTKSVIIATGATHRLLGILGEMELAGAGVSYCATCDGAFFKDKTVAVIGGGDVAVEDAIFLARLCKKVYVVHRRDELRAAKVLQDRLLALDNVEMLWSQVPEAIIGDGQVEKIALKGVKTQIQQEVNVDGVFIAVGMNPQTESFKGIVALDESGYIKAGEDCRTNIDGIYVVGDVRTKALRQIITAAADGANAITSVQDDA